MEQNKELSAQQSLNLIAETLNNSRKDITRKSGMFFILWGVLLAVFSLVVYFLWKGTGKSAWNLLWFAMPLIGYLCSSLLNKKDKTPVPDNLTTKLLGQVWGMYGLFASTAAAALIIIGNTATQLALAAITPVLVLLFGIGESISGVLLKNRAIIVSGWLIGIGGLVIFYLSGLAAEQMFIFTFAGIILALTGVIVKNQKR